MIARTSPPSHRLGDGLRAIGARPRTRRRALLGGALIALGLGIAADGLYIPVKAALGQGLLARAFAEAQATGAPTPPWPGADIAPIARLAFPTLGETRIVLNEASNEAMAWGPGRVLGAAEIGAAGVTALAAHRDTHFALLGDLEAGDPLEIETLDGRRLSYRVLRMEVVDSRVWRLPPPGPGPDVLVLSTCWPLGALTPGPERYVVFATRAP